jgi:anti-sigma regulatory factor (Ser/Thr protein kinase)
MRRCTGGWPRPVRLAGKSNAVTEVQWSLPPTARSVVEARHRVRDTLFQWGLDALTDAAVLLTSELVTNAVLHARTGLVLGLSRTPEGVRIAVTDGSAVSPAARRRASATATTGRGLLLLERLADAWSTDLTAGGKTVWFTLSSDRDPWGAASATRREVDR